ncbi:hypothetical protein KFU94_43495 [Chloroflexi bacterium TSY]|nr:hypothetical protein [Chloroflexi bacterium TSY]MBV7334993.1 hypothetical protein [Chloroflexi bacterium TSY]
MNWTWPEVRPTTPESVVGRSPSSLVHGACWLEVWAGHLDRDGNRLSLLHSGTVHRLQLQNREKGGSGCGLEQRRILDPMATLQQRTIVQRQFL